MAYRDEREKCPRCGAELVDAGSVRACSECRGQWVAAHVLVEMATNMQSPVRPIALDWIADKHETLACPTCGKPMETWKLPFYGRRTPEGQVVAHMHRFAALAPFHLLFERAWKRITDGDVPKYDEVKR